MRRLALVLVALLVAGCAGGSDGGGDTTAATPRLADLTSVDELRERFNADRGVPRLIVLVAPT